MRYLYTSDQHFRHGNIIKYCARPFKSVYDMDAEMRSKLMDAEASGARIIHLGDMSFDFERIVRDEGPLWTNPKDHVFVFGNHDDVKGKKLDVYAQHFGVLVGKPWVWQQNSLEIVDLLDGQPVRVILTHMPLDIVPEGAINVHGHIHNNSVRQNLNQFNASVERHDYTPVDLDRLAEVQRRLYENRY